MTAVEQWPKNLIAYSVQMVMQLKPGRTLTSRSVEDPESPWEKQATFKRSTRKKSLDFNRVSENVGLDVAVATNEDLGGGDSPCVGCGSKVNFMEDCENEPDDGCDEPRDKIMKLSEY